MAADDRTAYHQQSPLYPHSLDLSCPPLREFNALCGEQKLFRLYADRTDTYHTGAEGVGRRGQCAHSKQSWTKSGGAVGLGLGKVSTGSVVVLMPAFSFWEINIVSNRSLSLQSAQTGAGGPCTQLVCVCVCVSKTMRGFRHTRWHRMRAGQHTFDIHVCGG